MSICHTCKNWTTKTTPHPGMFLLYGCRELKLTFGIYEDWKAGKNQPKSCKDYAK